MEVSLGERTPCAACSGPNRVAWHLDGNCPHVGERAIAALIAAHRAEYEALLNQGGTMNVPTNSQPVVIQPLGRRNSRCARGCGHKFETGEITIETLQGDICLSCVTDVEMRRSMEAAR